ncbi:hypothetical protein BDN72DRAFT_962654 [Pluteus cervinus]|uniref:Uncharacterized protein n=1 Tax=Pluteus cervinus TaxID=181527 RepID=A0ACD3AHT1_9AGAR|nr:hypothetical protein BDN72DRAFT_962654 [Pluteus cervinus]
MPMSTLPPELIREIVEISVEANLSHAATLAAISRDFYEWTRPILCRTLMYYYTSPERQWPVPLDKLPEWLEANGRYVRNLIWGNTMDPGFLSVLTRCPGITNLAVWVGTLENDLTTILPILSTLRLSQFSINLYELFDKHNFSELEASSDAFRAVTHLEVFHDFNVWEDIEGIAHIPHLTHLAFSEQRQLHPAVVNSALEECKKLKVLAIMSDDSYQEGSPVQAFQIDHPKYIVGEIWGIMREDPRVVSFRCEFVSDWVYGSTGKKNMWALADEIVEGRLRDSNV